MIGVQACSRLLQYAVLLQNLSTTAIQTTELFFFFLCFLNSTPLLQLFHYHFMNYSHNQKYTQTHYRKRKYVWVENNGSDCRWLLNKTISVKFFTEIQCTKVGQAEN